MTTHYEIWDDGTGNSVGPSFATQAEAEVVLKKILHASGPNVARAMGILAFRPILDGTYVPETVLEGAELIERSRRAAAGLGAAG